MEFSREEYIELMTFGHPKRQMFVELFGLLVGLAGEWAAQGATQEEIDLVAFDWDYVPVVDCGGNMGIRGGQETRIVEETDGYTIEIDRLGRTTKLHKSVATLPLPLDFPVKDMDDWLRVKPLFEFHEDRIDWGAVERARHLRSQGALVVASIPGGFDTPRELMGEEAACLCYYDQPELMHDIIDSISETSFRVLERVTDKLPIDQLSVHEDLAGKSGPFIGPKQITEFISPYFRRIWELVSSRGAKLFDMDSDGNINAVIESFIDCGINAMHPMEPAAGMDIVAVREKVGQRLAMRGGIDKHVLRKSKEAIKKELEYKLQPPMRQGGMVFGLDHRIPNGTPLENYRYYVDLGREILSLPPRIPERRGWRRAAF